MKSKTVTKKVIHLVNEKQTKTINTLEKGIHLSQVAVDKASHALSHLVATSLMYLYRKEKMPLSVATDHLAKAHAKAMKDEKRKDEEGKGIGKANIRSYDYLLPAAFALCPAKMEGGKLKVAASKHWPSARFAQAVNQWNGKSPTEAVEAIASGKTTWDEMSEKAVAAAISSLEKEAFASAKKDSLLDENNNLVTPPTPQLIAKRIKDLPKGKDAMPQKPKKEKKASSSLSLVEQADPAVVCRLIANNAGSGKWKPKTMRLVLEIVTAIDNGQDKGEVFKHIDEVFPPKS